MLERPLHTERLTLRPATADDADPTWRFRRLESVNEWLTGCPADLDGYRELFSEPARLATTVIVTLGDDAAAPIIGDFMLRREDAWAQLDVAEQARDTQAELGWVLDPAYTGHGYATEAVRELLRHCFQDLGVRRVTANCFLDNDTSWSLMERVGMRRELHAVRDVAAPIRPLAGHGRLRHPRRGVVADLSDRRLDSRGWRADARGRDAASGTRTARSSGRVGGGSAAQGGAGFRWSMGSVHRRRVITPRRAAGWRRRCRAGRVRC